jgi:hypothetical protein
MFRKILSAFIFSAALVVTPRVLAQDVLVDFANGESISKADLDEYLSRRPDLIATVRNAYGAENALREMVMTRVLVLEGTEKYVPRVGQPKNQRFDDQYGLTVYQTLAKPCTKPSDSEEEKRYFLAHPDAFTIPTSIRLTRIILPRNQSIDGVDAQTKMMQWAHDWSTKKISIDEIAANAEKNYVNEVQGDIGWVTLEGTEELRIMRALASAKAGELVGPAMEGDFVYLFLITGKYEARQLTWDEAKNSVAERAVTYCRQKDAADIKRRLFEKFGVKFHLDAIKKLFQN